MQNTSTKTCRICGTEKPIDSFYIRPETGQPRTQCKDCQIEAQRYKKLGVCNARYDEMLVSQKGACAICKATLNSSRYTKLAVDHNHATGKVRGLLCTGCNTGIGLFKDSPIRIQAAIDYLNRHNQIDTKI